MNTRIPYRTTAGCMRCILAALVTIPANLHALTVPTVGYVVYPMPDGGIYRRFLNEAEGVRIVDAGRYPNINPKNGGIIAYVEGGQQAALTDVDGLTRRPIGAPYSGMNNIWWTDRGDRFTFSYANRRQWGMMDTLGNFTEIPVPQEVPNAYAPGANGSSMNPQKVYRPINYTQEGGLGYPMIRGDIIMFNEMSHKKYGHIDQVHPERGIPRQSLVEMDGCFAALSSNGEAGACHNHGGLKSESIYSGGGDTVIIGSLFSHWIMANADCGGGCQYYGIKWSNEYQWVVLRDQQMGRWNLVRIPPPVGGGSSDPDNWVELQSYGGPTQYQYYAMPDLWIGPFPRSNIAGPPAISHQYPNLDDSIVVTIQPFDPGSQVYYTLDGTEPTQQSTLYSQPFGMRLSSDSVVVKARAYKTGVDPSMVVSCTVVRIGVGVDLLDAVDVPVLPGLSFKSYTGTFSQVPDFSALTSVADGTVDSITLSPATQSTDFAILYEGYVSVPIGCVYQFALSCDDAAELRIHDSLVVAASWTTGRKTGSIGLKAGLHPISLGFIQGGGPSSLSISFACSTLAEPLRPIGKDLCFHYDSSASQEPLVLAPAAGAVFQLGDTVQIRWEYHSAVRIDYSTNAGRSFPFTICADSKAGTGEKTFDWYLTLSDTDMVSTQGRILVADYGDPSIATRSGLFTVGGAALGTHRNAYQPSGSVLFAAGNRTIVCPILPGEPLPQVTVTTVDGRSVRLRSVRANGTLRWKIDAAGPGIYFVNVEGTSRTFTKRMVIAR